MDTGNSVIGKLKRKTALATFVAVLAGMLAMLVSIAGLVYAATPTAPSYEFVFSPKTGIGSDATGDGGGGIDPFRFNEYYVGQSFSITVRLLAGSAKVNGGDARFDIIDGYLNCALDTSVHALSGNLSMQVTSNGNGTSRYWIVNTAVNDTEYVTGTQNFARINCSVLKKYDGAVTMLSTATPFPITWYFTGIGDRTDTNIAEFQTANEILASPPENALIYLWPDTNKPYVDSFAPTTTATNVPVTQAVGFNFNDKNTTSGDETGVKKSSLVGEWKVQSSATFVAGNIAWSTCTGTWVNATGGNICPGTMNPVSKIGGSRNYSYNTAYDVCFNSGQDQASPLQNPPDPAPNTMDNTCITFTTEADIYEPTVTAYAPTGNAVNVNSNVTFTVKDLRDGSSIYGTGVDPATIRINISGKKEGNVDFDVNLTCADDGVTCTPLGDDLENGHKYGYDVVIDPSLFATDPFDAFAQDEAITVTVTSTTDYASNVMNDFAWSFRTKDTTPPEIINIAPAENDFFEITDNELTFEVTDSGVGVAQEDILVRIGDDFYQLGGENSDRISFTGDANHWYVTIVPLMDLTLIDKPLAIAIAAKDSSGNKIVPDVMFALSPGQGVTSDRYDEGYADGEAAHADDYDDGYSDGYDDGLAANEGSGYSEGYEKGYEEGYADGLDDEDNNKKNYDEGYADGLAANEGSGYDQGYEDGLAANEGSGYEIGYNKGYADGVATCGSGGAGNNNGGGNNGGSYDDGYEDGKKDGYGNGFDDGYAGGLIDGIKNGYGNGFLDGYAKGKSENSGKECDCKNDSESGNVIVYPPYNPLPPLTPPNAGDDEDESSVDFPYAIAGTGAKSATTTPRYTSISWVFPIATIVMTAAFCQTWYISVNRKQELLRLRKEIRK
jgi:hypothetical protein